MSRTIKDRVNGFYPRVPSFYKKMRRKQRRKIEKFRLRNDKEPPIFKRTDEWDYW